MQTLKEAREARGVKLGAVAEYLGISRQTYSSYEKNQDNMNISQARSVCEFLHVPFNEIFLQDEVSNANHSAL